MEVGSSTQCRELFNRLMCRPIFSQPNRVVGEYIQHSLTHERGHSDRIARVFHEDQESGAIWNKTAVQGDTVHDGSHGELSYTVVKVIAARRLL